MVATANIKGGKMKKYELRYTEKDEKGYWTPQIKTLFARDDKEANEMIRLIIPKLKFLDEVGLSYSPFSSGSKWRKKEQSELERKEAKDRKIIQLIQSRCVHRRMEILKVAEDFYHRKILYCQDCLKRFPEKTI